MSGNPKPLNPHCCNEFFPNHNFSRNHSTMTGVRIFRTGLTLLGSAVCSSGFMGQIAPKKAEPQTPNPSNPPMPWNLKIKPRSRALARRQDDGRQVPGAQRPLEGFRISLGECRAQIVQIKSFSVGGLLWHEPGSGLHVPVAQQTPAKSA